MKKFTYLATALLVLAGAAGCKKNSDVQDPELQPSGKTRTVTIQAGQGATKTQVIGGTLKWCAGDNLYIVPQESGSFTPAALSIKSGVGEASGTFEGQVDASITDATPIYGYCGGDWSYSAGKFSVNMHDTQTYVANGLAEDAYPSIGSGSIQDGITLSNPFGVLRVTVKGADDETLTSVSLKSFNSSKKLAGSFTLAAGTWTVSGGETDEIIMSCGDVQLSAEGIQLNFVVPTFTFASGELRVQATVNKNGTAGKKYTETNSSPVAITANNVTKIERTIVLVKDVQSNWYDVCKIGTQTWMAENLRCNQYSQNSDAETSIKSNPIPTSTPAVSTPYYTASTYSAGGNAGYLYNWAAAVGVANGQSQTSELSGRQGICPDGWHIPTAKDWDDLKDKIEGTDGKGSDTAGKYLKNETGWEPEEGIENLNCYGFAALPAGYAEGSSVDYVGTDAYFWTATPREGYSHSAYIRYLGSYDDILSSYYDGKYNGQSVRCLKN